MRGRVLRREAGPMSERETSARSAMTRAAVRTIGWTLAFIIVGLVGWALDWVRLELLLIAFIPAWSVGAAFFAWESLAWRWRKQAPGDAPRHGDPTLLGVGIEPKPSAWSNGGGHGSDDASDDQDAPSPRNDEPSEAPKPKEDAGSSLWRAWRTGVAAGRTAAAVVHANGTVEVVSARLADMLGAGVDDLQGRSFAELFDEQDRAMVLAKATMGDRARTLTFEARLDIPDVARWVYVEMTPITGLDGRVAALAARFSDVTAHHVRDRELRREREVFESLVANLPTPVYWKDATGVYLGCNEAFASLVGLSDPAEAPGKTDADLGWPASQAARLASVDREAADDLTAHVARDRVDHQPRHGERAQAVGALELEHPHAVLDGRDAADARADDHAAPVAVERVEVDRRVVNRLAGRGDAKVCDPVEALCVAGLEQARGRPVLDLTGGLDAPLLVREARELLALDRAQPASALAHRPPCGGGVRAEIGHGATPGHDDTRRRSAHRGIDSFPARVGGLGAAARGDDVVDCGAHGPDLLGLFVGDVRVELVLERHHQLDRVEAVGVEVLLEARLAADLRRAVPVTAADRADLVDDKFDDLRLDFAFRHADASAIGETRHGHPCKDLPISLHKDEGEYRHMPPRAPSAPLRRTRPLRPIRPRARSAAAAARSRTGPSETEAYAG